MRFGAVKVTEMSSVSQNWPLWGGFAPFFKLPDFILSVQLLQLPKSTV